MNAAARGRMDRQAGGILPAPCFHAVFTPPRPVARIALQNRGTVPGILFRTAAGTLRAIGAGTAEGIRNGRPACPRCGAPSGPPLTLTKRPGEDPEDLLDTIRRRVRQRGPPRPGGAT